MRPLIYDGFLFWKEFDILEIRLHELAAVVDYFVLVEATETFSGISKPLFYAQQRWRFRDFADRIIHVIVDDLPAQADPWGREHHQRNCILRGLSACRPEDVVLMSDVDEIPRPRLVIEHAHYAGVTVFVPSIYYYFLNCRGSTTYGGTCMLPYGTLAQHRLAPQGIRLGHIGEVPRQIVPDGGWHFSYCTTPTDIREKIQAYSHQEYNRPRFTDLHQIEAAKQEARDLFGRGEMSFQIVPLDDSFPRYVLENQTRFSHLIRALA